MRSLALFVMVACLFDAPAWAQKTPGGKKPAEAKPIVEGEVGKKLDEHMARVDKDDGGFCSNALVTVGGKVLLEKGYGLADASKRSEERRVGKGARSWW